jgi:hypothetical protein
MRQLPQGVPLSHRQLEIFLALKTSGAASFP